MKPLRITWLLSCICCAQFVQGQSVPDFSTFGERIHYWKTLDSVSFREEYTVQTNRLRNGKLTKQSVLEWAESTALLKDKSNWDRHFGALDSLLVTQEGGWDSGLLHFRILNASAQSYLPPPHLVQWEKRDVVWSLFNGQLTQQIGQFGSSITDHSQLQLIPSPPPVFSWTSACIALVIALISAVLLGWTFWLTRSRNQARVDSIKNPLLIDIQRTILSGTPDARQIIHIDYVEFKLGMSPLQPLIDKNKQWGQLNHADLGMLHLILRGHSMENCAQFLEKTKGHMYNQRSKIRHALSVPADMDFAAFIREAVATHTGRN